MTIVLGMLQMPIRRCPKPSCGQHVPDATEIRKFVTCRACGLQFRFYPDTKYLGVKTEDEKVHLIHQDEDLSKFGRRHVPPDVVGVEREESQPPDQVSPLAVFPTMADMGLNKVAARTLTSENLSSLGLVSLKETGSGKPQFVGLDSSQLPSVDWNSGPSGMAAWLNSSAAPAHDGEHFGPNPDTFQLETEQLQQEKKDIESLRRVHFVSTIPESQPLRDIVEEYQAMPLDTQIYVRKIVDRFPTVPSYLAKRFAHANAGRLYRLWDQKQNIVEEDSPLTRLKGKSWSNTRQNASLIRTEDRVNSHQHRKTVSSVTLTLMKCTTKQNVESPSLSTYLRQPKKWRRTFSRDSWWPGAAFHPRCQ